MGLFRLVITEKLIGSTYPIKAVTIIKKRVNHNEKPTCTSQLITIFSPSALRVTIMLRATAPVSTGMVLAALDYLHLSMSWLLE